MSLNKPKLTVDLAAAFALLEPTIKAKLLQSLGNPLPRHTSLNVNDDDPVAAKRRGGTIENNTFSLYSVMEKIDKWAIENLQGNLDTPKKRADFKNNLWKETSKEWAESLSLHISKDIVATLSTQLAPVLANIIDGYIKSATLSVIIPPGTLTIGVGAASIPNPVPIELFITPGPLPSFIETTLIKIPTFGGIK